MKWPPSDPQFSLHFLLNILNEFHSPHLIFLIILVIITVCAARWLVVILLRVCRVRLFVLIIGLWCVLLQSTNSHLSLKVLSSSFTHVHSHTQGDLTGRTLLSWLSSLKYWWTLNKFRFSLPQSISLQHVWKDRRYYPSHNFTMITYLQPTVNSKKWDLNHSLKQLDHHLAMTLPLPDWITYWAV